MHGARAKPETKCSKSDTFTTADACVLVRSRKEPDVEASGLTAEQWCSIAGASR
jgi:hypothetical protein